MDEIAIDAGPVNDVFIFVRQANAMYIQSVQFWCLFGDEPFQRDFSYLKLVFYNKC
jgi:hypothetical protein